MKIEMESIGYVNNQVKKRKDLEWGEELSEIIVNLEYKEGLKGLTDFSHAIILYYLDQANFKEEHLVRRPQNRQDMPLTGIFSQRGKDRPNQIGMTTINVISVVENCLTVKGLDAIDGTPVLDIKPYYPVYDQKEKATVPEWVDQLMKHYF